ncbi:MAG: flagellar hook-basal body protein [Clostridia bacterium]|nr:flagellar hook-basal body protein [Clostridia bacterium]
MIQALNIAASGLKAQQTSIDTIANNISNVGTTGYKKERANFKDALYTAMINPADAASAANLQKGSGVIVDSVSSIFTPATIVETGNVLDVAIANEDFFFAVENQGGQTVYTRDGNFAVSADSYLTKTTGEYVLDENGNRILVNGDINDLRISRSGDVYLGSDEPIARIAVVGFNNPDGLEKLGGNNFAATQASGAATEAENVDLRHKFIENSNVDMTEEITNLIKAQRAYQLSSRVIATADEAEGLANNLRR